MEAPARRPAAVAAPINVFAAMEDLCDKLKILNYEQDFCRTKDMKPLTRTYFALPGKTSEQFPYFSALTSWLFQRIGMDFLEWGEFEDPNQIINNVVELSRQLGFGADFPVSKLRHGAGDAVVLTLNFLVDKALAKKGFKVQAPQYSQLDGDDSQPPPEETGEDVEEEDIKDEVVEEDLDVDGGGLYDGGFISVERDDKESKQTMEMLEPQIDPAQFQLELLRVEPKLKFRAEPPTKEWRTHLDQSVKHEKMMKEALPEAKGQLEKIATSLRKTVDRIAAKERHLNREFEHLSDEFRERQKKLDEIQETYHALSGSVSELQNELQSKTDQLESLKDQMNSRTTSMTDNTPLRRLTTSMADLKKEVAAMEFRMGIMGQTLLQAQLKQLSRANDKSGDILGGDDETSESENDDTGSDDDSRDDSDEDDD